ncbi:MAG TPA: NAD-dependent epimerase/dehydratase family protein [Terriglobia bacterium]|nr:NAD-dependent epimerase/dehydratase family protein [Terriglobia bacterium]
MKKRILITGGAGFIGSHLADELLAHGYQVRVLDCLSPQVHGNTTSPPGYLDRDVEFVRGDVRDSRAVGQALKSVDIVYHLAALVGVGQSMYQVAEYCSVNDLGTAVLLENLIAHPVEKLVVASSMSIYGEGLYSDSAGQFYENAQRSLDQVRKSDWNIRNAAGEPLKPLPTPETKLPSVASVYALSKYNQERICLIIGRAYGVPTVALRFFNAYGTRQALSNPYTGVLAIFASRILNGKPPLVFEDGMQQRDFVAVEDVARACRLAIETKSPDLVDPVLNIGSGKAVSILQVARSAARALGCHSCTPEVTGKYRMGDIRHCFADITLARKELGFEPRMTLEKGLVKLAEWLTGQVAVDRVMEASAELTSRGLAI